MRMRVAEQQAFASSRAANAKPNEAVTQTKKSDAETKK